MIKNIVFDLGRVMVHYEPLDYVETLYGEGEKASHLYRAVFGSKSWLDLDRGSINEEQAFECMVKEAPYPDEIQYLLTNWVEILKPDEDVLRIFCKLKELEYPLFLLSNFHKRAFEKICREYAFFTNFDGILISSHAGLIKPETAIYQKLADAFSLTACECLFIDDTLKNVTAAEELGMEGIVFKDALQLEGELVSRGILCPYVVGDGNKE